MILEKLPFKRNNFAGVREKILFSGCTGGVGKSEVIKAIVAGMGSYSSQE